jgi:hypothetical protein
METKSEMECYDILLDCFRRPVFKADGNPDKLANCFKIMSKALDDLFEINEDSCIKEEVLRVSLSAFKSACVEFFKSIGHIPMILIGINQRTGLMKLSFKFNSDNIRDFELCEGVESDWCHPYESQ